MEQLSYTTAGQVGPTAVYAPPYAAPPPGPGSLPPPPPAAASAPLTGVLPYGVEIPNRVFVGGCPFSMTDQQLGDFFAKYGNVKDSKIISDRGTGKSKGYGFVTFSTEEEAVNVHAMGSIFYNEKKLNLARAIRKCGGQFNRANQEYVNGQRAVWTHPSGYLIQQFDGNWYFEQNNPHSQPVKPCYPFYYPSPPPAAQPPPFYVNSGGFSPSGSVNGTTFFPQAPQLHSQPVTGVRSEQPSSDHAADDEAAEDKDGDKNELQTPEKKDSANSDQLESQMKQLSLDSAYTSEADLERSTSPHEQVSPAECQSGDDNDIVVEEPPPDLNRIVEVRKSPQISHSPPKYLQKRPASLSHFHSSAPLSSPPPPAGHYSSNGLYFHPAAYAPAPYAYSPYTPQAAIQTIGPMYHSHQ